MLVALAPVAWVVATARDARRFAAGAILACVIWFVVWYPNLSGLPLPSTIVNAYQGLLPTYLYAFQFPVNTDPVPSGSTSWRRSGRVGSVPAGPTLFVFLLITCVIVGYAPGPGGSRPPSRPRRGGTLVDRIDRRGRLTSQRRSQDAPDAPGTRRTLADRRGGRGPGVLGIGGRERDPGRPTRRGATAGPRRGSRAAGRPGPRAGGSTKP